MSTRKKIALAFIATLGLGTALTITCYSPGFSSEGHAESLTQFKVSEAFKTPLRAYKIHIGQFPTTAEGLLALVDDFGTEGWRGPYIERETHLKDPWGRPFRYRFPGVKNHGWYDLYSLGPDGIESEDDITNWD